MGGRLAPFFVGRVQPRLWLGGIRPCGIPSEQLYLFVGYVLYCSIPMIKVLDKTFAIFESLRVAGPTQLKDLSAATGITKTTLFTIVKTLQQLGYLEQDPSGRYAIAPRFRALASPITPAMVFTRLATRAVSELAEQIGENTTAILLDHGKRKIAARHEGGRLVSIDSGFNETDFYTFASGRILLAHMTVEERKALWESQGAPGPRWPEVRTRAELEAALRQVKAAPVVQVEHDDTIGLAAQVILLDHGVVGALGIFLPASRFRGAARGRLADALAQAATAFRHQVETALKRPGPNPEPSPSTGEHP